jgi:hypothetical protein
MLDFFPIGFLGNAQRSGVKPSRTTEYGAAAVGSPSAARSRGQASLTNRGLRLHMQNIKTIQKVHLPNVNQTSVQNR